MDVSACADLEAALVLDAVSGDVTGRDVRSYGFKTLL